MKITFEKGELEKCCRVLREWYCLDITPLQLRSLVPDYKLAYVVGDGASDTVNRERLIDWICAEFGIYEGWPINADPEEKSKKFYAQFAKEAKRRGLKVIL